MPFEWRPRGRTPGGRSRGPAVAGRNAQSGDHAEAAESPLRHCVVVPAHYAPFSVDTCDGCRRGSCLVPDAGPMMQAWSTSSIPGRRPCRSRNPIDMSAGRVQRTDRPRWPWRRTRVGGFRRPRHRRQGSELPDASRKRAARSCACVTSDTATTADSVSSGVQAPNHEGRLRLLDVRTATRPVARRRAATHRVARVRPARPRPPCPARAGSAPGHAKTSHCRDCA